MLNFRLNISGQWESSFEAILVQIKQNNLRGLQTNIRSRQIANVNYV